MKRRAAAAMALAALAAVPGGAGVPVRIGGNAVEDACGTIAQVAGIGPRGFLAVRDGPGLRFRTLDRLGAGRMLNICEERGQWVGVVYGGGGGGGAAACGVATPRPGRSAYAGPCRSGWVSRRYVEAVAG